MRYSIWLLVVMVLAFAREAGAASSCGPAPPSGEPSEEAKRAYETALDLSKDGRFDEALSAYQRAYDLSPSYVILFNLGKAAALTSDFVRAIHAYECHLEHGGSAIEPVRRSEVEAELRRLRTEAALVDVSVDEPGVVIEVDGVAVGRSPLSDPVLVNPGKRLLRVKGSRTQSKAIEIQKGGRLVVEFKLGAPAPTVTKSFRFPNGVVGAAWVVTGLLGVSTAVTGTMALVLDKDIEDEVFLGPGRVPPEGSPLDDKIESAKTLATTTDVLLTLLCVSGSAAVSFSIVNATATSDEAPPKTALRIELSPGGASLRGTW